MLLLNGSKSIHLTWNLISVKANSRNLHIFLQWLDDVQASFFPILLFSTFIDYYTICFGLFITSPILLSRMLFLSMCIPCNFTQLVMILFLAVFQLFHHQNKYFYISMRPFFNGEQWGMFCAFGCIFLRGNGWQKTCHHLLIKNESLTSMKPKFKRK
jgi:hypothetical protein